MKHLFQKGEANIAKRPEIRKKISEALIGHEVSEETIKKAVETRKRNGPYICFQGPHTEKTKKILREKALERFKDGMPEETKAKIKKNNAHYWLGKTVPREIVEKQRNARTYRRGEDSPIYGTHPSEETRKKESESHTGKTGELASNWQGGKSFELYPSEWTETLREAARRRDNYVCQECGKTQEEELKELGRKLSVHHLDYDKKNCNSDNLLTACTSCNAKFNSRREYWKEYFSKAFNKTSIRKILTGFIFSNLRILYKVEPRDSYILNYRNLLARYGNRFFDIYHLAAFWGVNYSPKRVMEIGSRTGLSLVQLLSSYIEYPNDMRICLFDRWDDGLSNPELIKKYLNHLAIPVIDKIEFHTGDSAETVPEFKKTNKDKFSWILVDGSHVEECVTKDLENVKDLVAENGVIVIDDINALPEDRISVKPAWEKFKMMYAEQFEFHEDCHGKGVSWAVRNNKLL